MKTNHLTNLHNFEQTLIWLETELSKFDNVDERDNPDSNVLEMDHNETQLQELKRRKSLLDKDISVYLKKYGLGENLKVALKKLER